MLARILCIVSERENELVSRLLQAKLMSRKRQRVLAAISGPGDVEGAALVGAAAAA